MGYVFEELIRVGAEQSNEEAGEHFTPREVIKLMVNLLLAPEQDLRKSHIVKTLYDPACGTGGMLSVAEQYIRDLNDEAKPFLFGQDWNDEAWAVCKSDMLVKGEDADNIRLGDTFTEDAFAYDEQDRKYTFDYMLANSPFGVEWKQQQQDIKREAATLGDKGRFGAGLPRINDGSLLFLWVLTNRKTPERTGKVQLIDARRFFVKMPKSLGNKRNKLGDPSDRPGEPDQIGGITRIFGHCQDGETCTFPEEDPITKEPVERERIVSKVFDNADFGFHN